MSYPLVTLTRLTFTKVIDFLYTSTALGYSYTVSRTATDSLWGAVARQNSTGIRTTLGSSYDLRSAFSSCDCHSFRLQHPFISDPTLHATFTINTPLELRQNIYPYDTAFVDQHAFSVGWGYHH